MSAFSRARAATFGVARFAAPPSVSRNSRLQNPCHVGFAVVGPNSFGPSGVANPRARINSCLQNPCHVGFAVVGPNSFGPPDVATPCARIYLPLQLDNDRLPSIIRVPHRYTV